MGNSVEVARKHYEKATQANQAKAFDFRRAQSRAQSVVRPSEAEGTLPAKESPKTPSNSVPLTSLYSDSTYPMISEGLEPSTHGLKVRCSTD